MRSQSWRGALSVVSMLGAICLACGCGNGAAGNGGVGGGGAGGIGTGGTGGTGGAEVPIDVEVVGHVLTSHSLIATESNGVTVEVYAYADFGTPIATVQGTNDATGVAFELTLAQVLPSDLFLFVVSGGVVRDADDDGILLPPEASPPNGGRFHAIATAGRLAQGIFEITELSELLYWRLRYFMAAEYDQRFVASAADSLATFALRSDLDGSGEADWDDVLAFHPVDNRDLLVRPYFPNMSAFGGDIVGGGPASDLAAAAFAFTEPFLVFQMLGGGRKLQLRGDLLYFCESTLGLRIFDVSNPNVPVSLGSYDTPGFATDVQLVGNLAYVADGSGGLQIIDVSNPDLPAFRGAAGPMGNAEAVRVVGDLAYVVDASFTDPMFHVVDVSDPAAPSILGSAPGTSDANSVRVFQSYAYVGTNNNGIRVYDVSDPAQPELVGNANLDDRDVRDLELHEDHLLVAGRRQFEVLELKDPERPFSILTIPLPGDGAFGMGFHDGRLFIGRSSGAIAVVDVSNPTAPLYLGRLHQPESIWGISVGPDLIATSTVNDGFSLLSAVTPVPHADASTVRIQGQIRALEARSEKAYVGTSSPNELWVVDGSDPERGERQGGVVVSGAVDALALRDDLAFIASTGLEVVDVSDPTMPILLGGDTEFPVPFFQNLAVNQDILYGGDRRMIQVVDVSTPTAPELIDTLATVNNVTCLAVDAAAQALLSCESFSGMRVNDVTMPAAPVLGSLILDTVFGIDARFNFAYVAHLPSGSVSDELRIVDYSNLAMPVPAGGVDLPGVPRGVALGENHAYVAVEGAGVQVVDVSNPNFPVIVGELLPRLDGSAIATSGDSVYLSTGSFGSGDLVLLRAFKREVP